MEQVVILNCSKKKKPSLTINYRKFKIFLRGLKLYLYLFMLMTALLINLKNFLLKITKILL